MQLQMPPRINQNSLKKTTNEFASSSCVDRISDLPKNMIDYIFEKLEIWDVVRTSVLSKKLRQNWTSLPQLTFTDTFTHRYKQCFESVVFSVLFQHIGPIPKFSLSLHPDILHTSKMIVPWLCFLSKNGVRDLTLIKQYDNDNELLILPSYFFSCSELRVLMLCNCLFKSPFTFNGFRSLTSLTCHFVTFEGLTFESLLCCCPLIEELTLRFCTGLGRILSIVAPNLRVFVIESHRTEYISFKNTQSISSLSLYLHFPELPAKERNRSYVSEFFSCLRNLENLSLQGEYIVHMLTKGFVPKRLPNSLNFLKDLKLNLFDFCEFDAISCLLCIIRSSPNLQLLDISAYSSKKYKAQVLGYLEQQLDFLDCSLDHLHNIKISCICGAPPEMLMIKFLLAISPYLKNMVIQIDPCDAEKALRISTELLRFRRASTGAEVTLIRCANVDVFLSQ